jgi:uncharacterized membrane protein
MKKAWYTAQLVAQGKGIELVAMTTRFDGIEYFIEDRNTLDEDGLPSVIFQTDDREAAVRFYINKVGELEAQKIAGGTK